jgi:hypothetical protein
VEPLILPPIAHQSVYAAATATTKENWQQRNNSNFEPNFIYAGDSTKLDLDRLPPGWEVELTADGIRYYIDRNIKNTVIEGFCKLFHFRQQWQNSLDSSNGTRKPNSGLGQDF